MAISPTYVDPTIFFMKLFEAEDEQRYAEQRLQAASGSERRRWRARAARADEALECLRSYWKPEPEPGLTEHAQESLHRHWHAVQMLAREFNQCHPAVPFDDVMMVPVSWGRMSPTEPPAVTP